MASTLDFVVYICEQISGAGDVTYKKMFGEYGIYCNAKIIGLVCENQFFVKKTIAGGALLELPEEAAPYTGAKPHFVIDCLENRDFLSLFIRETYNELPMPKPKKKR